MVKERDEPIHPDQVEQAARWIAGARRVVFFTGAGISTESGLPDFRGPDGVWTRRDKGLPPPRTRKPWHLVEPNAGHLAIVELQELGKLDFLISQNVDNLHLKSGIRPELIAELHGNSTLMKCLGCGRKFTHEEAGWDKAVWGNGYRTEPVRPGQPTCPECGGRLISSVVNFGDPLPADELDASFEHAARCDVFVIVGSSLVVSPACNIPEVALEGGARVILVNKGETPFDEAVHMRVWGSAGEFLERVVARVRELLQS
ncbi:MAG: SIR2 family NAD-dependent protein deacylase [Promethearchaeota archaeon]